MPYGLTDNQLDQLKYIFSLHAHVERVILYGSRAKGNYRKGSDVDITLLGENLSKSDLNEIENEIDDLLLAYFFDISLYHQITNQELLNQIKAAGKVIYEK